MASEIELERMIIRLIGDGSSYQKMLRDAETSTRSVTNTIQASAKKIESLGKSITSAGKSMQGLGAKMTLGITAPLALLNRQIISAGADFDSGFAGVRKTVDATEEQLAQMKDQFRALALEIPVSTDELLKLGEVAGQLGIEQKNIIAFAKTMAMLTASTNLSAEEGAVDLARFMNITGMAQEDVGRLGSSIVALGNNFATSEKDIVAMSMRLAGAGKSMGLTPAQITGVATALSAMGLEAEMGGSAMSQFMSSMAKSVALGGKDLEGMAKLAGTSAEEFKTTFRQDTLGAINQVIVGLSKLDKEAREVALSEMGVDGIRMSDMFRRLAGNIEITTKATDLSTKAFKENVALVNEANQRFKTFWSQVQLLKNQFADLALDLFDLMRPALEGVLQSVGRFVAWLKALNPETKIMIMNVLKIAAVLGPLITILGTLVVVGGTVVTAVGAIAGAMAALSGPVLIVVAAVTALAAAWGAVLAYLIGADGIAEAVNIVLARMQNFANYTIGFLQHFGQNFGILINWLRDNWKTILDDMGTATGLWIGNMAQNAAVLVTTLVRLFTVFAGFMTAVFKKIFQTDFISAIVNGIKAALTLFSGFFGKVVDGLQASFAGKKIDFGEFISQIEKDFKAGAEDLNPLDAIQNVLTEQVGQLKSPLAGFNPTTPLPELILGGMPEVPRNALADGNALGAVAAPFQAAMQPGSKERVAVEQFVGGAKDAATSLQEKIATGIDRLVEQGEEQLKDPGLLLQPSGGLGSP